MRWWNGFDESRFNWSAFCVVQLKCAMQIKMATFSYNNVIFSIRLIFFAMSVTDDRCPILYHFVSIFPLRSHYIWEFTAICDMRQTVGCGSILSIRSIVRVYARNIFFYVVSIFYRDFIVFIHFYVKRKPKKQWRPKPSKTLFDIWFHTIILQNSKWLRANENWCLSFSPFLL